MVFGFGRSTPSYPFHLFLSAEVNDAIERQRAQWSYPEDREFLAEMADRKGEEGLNRLSGLLSQTIGRELEADDFCKLRRAPRHAGYVNFFSTKLSHGGVKSLLFFLRGRNSVFNPDLLCATSEHSKQSVLYELKRRDLIESFFDPFYWEIAPEKLEELKEKAPRFCRDAIQSALAEIRRRKEQTATLPAPQVPAAPPVHVEMEAGIARLAAFGQSLPRPSVEALREEIRAAGGDIQKIWAYGETLIQARRAFSLAALEVTLSLLGQHEAAPMIASFILDLAKARAALSALSAPPEPPSATTKRGFWGGRTSEGGNPAHLSFEETLILTRRAGQNLQKIAPCLEKAEKQTIDKMRLFFGTAEVNKFFADCAALYIEAAAPFLPGGEESDALSSIALDCLTDKIDLLCGIQTKTGLEKEVDTATVGLFRQQAKILALQNGAVVPDLASSVSRLHRTVDLLQSAAVSKGLADISCLAGDQQIRDLCLVAEQNLAAIDSTLKSAHTGLQELDREALKILQERAGSQQAQLDGATTPERTTKALTATPTGTQP